MDTGEVVRLALQIQRSSADRSPADVLSLLCDLDKFQVTAEQLETTDVVRVLYALLKGCRDDGVKRATKRLLSKWKKQYSGGGRGVTHREESAGPDGPESAETQEEASSSSSGGPPDLQTLTPVRSKCVELLLAALRPELPDRAAAMARDIELHIHELHKSSPLKYKACVRSKVANLRNPKNQHLRRGLDSGSLSPGAFARMSAEEMASADLRRLREEYSSRGVSERQLPGPAEGTPTRKVRCKRCGGSECSVTQVSRGALFLPAWVRRGGADEDAMTFMTCSRCGQQWYHSGWICL